MGSVMNGNMCTIWGQEKLQFNSGVTGGSVKKRPPHPQSLKINFNFIAGKDKGCGMMGKVYKPRPQ